jgi:hypothetical protein
MSIIERQRDEVIANHNTAQRIFITMLEQMDNAHADEIRFTEIMHGDLDFSILRDRKFTHVRRIFFEQEGEVTHLRNIPEGITHIECPDQLLTSIDPPTSIEEINLNNNALKTYNTSETPKLSVLRISDNELTLLDTKQMPNLLTLECDNNQLSHLDLGPLRSLTSLHCSNNPLLKLEHVPPTLDDLVMENNPLMELDHSDPTKRSGAKGSGAKQIDYLTSIQQFFSMKQAYDTKLKKLKRAAFDRATNRKAGRRLAKAVYAPCISCKRKVGTIFDTRNGEYRAACGDKTKPCRLHIHIYNGDYFNLFSLLKLYQTDVRDVQEKIIQQKLDTLFDYVDQYTATKEFKETLTEYTETSEMYKKMMDKYTDIYKNKEREIQTGRTMEKVYRIREDMTAMLEEYKKTGNHDILTTLVKMHLDDLEPAIHQLRMLKYEVMSVDIDEDNTQLSVLHQRRVAFHRDDFTIGDEPTVMKFVMDTDA